MSFAPSFFEQLEDRLSLAVYDINMGIAEIREQTGLRDLTMHYSAGGKTEIYIAGNIQVELPSGSSPAEIGNAIKAASPSALSRVDDAVAALKKKVMDQAA